MSSSRPAVTKPTPAELFKLAQSPLVKIYVGDPEELFELPKDVLGYFSPYFRVAFNGNFKEGVEGVLRLPDENARWFECIVQYMSCRSCATLALLGQEAAMKSATTGVQVAAAATAIGDACFDFIRFCDRYDICEAASAAAKPLGKCLDNHGSSLMRNASQLRADFDFVFNRLHADNSTLKTVARFLAKTLYSNDRNDPINRAFAEKFVLEYGGTIPYMLKAEVQMTTWGGGRTRSLKRDMNPSYVLEDEQT